MLYAVSVQQAWIYTSPYLKTMQHHLNKTVIFKAKQLRTTGGIHALCPSQTDAELQRQCSLSHYLGVNSLLRNHQLTNFMCTVIFLAVTIGHETVMGRATFFSGVPPVNQQFDFDKEYPFLEELTGTKTQVGLLIHK